MYSLNLSSFVSLSLSLSVLFFFSRTLVHFLVYFLSLSLSLGALGIMREKNCIRLPDDCWRREGLSRLSGDTDKS